MDAKLDDAPKAKKAKTDDLEWTCRTWLAEDELPLSLQSELQADLQSKKTMTQEQLQRLFDQHGLRTSVVRSPREALSIYKESFGSVESHFGGDAGGLYLVLMLSSHSRQESLEQTYRSTWKKLYCLKSFCDKISKAIPAPEEGTEVDQSLLRLLGETKELCIAAIIGANREKIEPTTITQKFSAIREAAIASNSHWRFDQLQHEYDRIEALNASLGNALLQKFVVHRRLTIKDVYFKRSHLPQYERLSVYLYDSQIDEIKPPPIALLPCSRWHSGPEPMVAKMVERFWRQLLKRGYYASNKLREAIAPKLAKYFMSGLADNPNTPLLLTAHFSPKFPLSFYFYGKAGSGKSSLVRNFGPALNNVIEEFADPDLLVRFVKQNLNKPLETLQLELDLRPNNNDMSVMSIIQSRRMTLKQSKPGLVLVALEEVASVDGNPDQLSICQLLSQRFSGRKGTYTTSATAPKNSAKRGISGDATIIPLFTSNYELEGPCMVALGQLEMFRSLQTIHVEAVSGMDRENFAYEYLQHQLSVPRSKIVLNIPLAEGDTRPLVRHLRMLSYYINALPAADNKVVVTQEQSNCQIDGSASSSIDLTVGSMGNLYPQDTQSKLVDPSVNSVVAKASSIINDSSHLFELRFVLSFWLSRTLAPAVLVSSSREKIKAIGDAIEDSLYKETVVHVVRNIDASSYKMMKSLYDPPDARNLRDDILRFGNGATVVVELICPSVDAQLCIREMIEDTPSQTAFSSEKSALYKSGILFLVAIDTELSPEVRSRASLIL